MVPKGGCQSRINDDRQMRYDFQGYDYCLYSTKGPIMKKLFILLLVLPITTKAQDKIPDTIEAGWKGEPVCVVLFEDDKIRTGTCTYPPGVGQDRHSHGGYFTYVVSGGTLRVTTERGTFESTSITGTSGKSDGVKWHELENIGDTTIKFLFVETKYED